MSDGRGRIWARRLSEAGLIVVSVFLAVYLEGKAEERSEQEAARLALVQLLGELRDDAGDFDRIIAKQDSLSRDYDNLRRWLGSEGAYPADSVGHAILRVTNENSTLFPRRASWTTMVSGNQLTALDAPELVLQLGQLYESTFTRIEYNGRYYDEGLFALLPNPTVVRWQTLDSQPLAGGPTDRAALASALEFLHMGWNQWYRDLLISYRGDVTDAISAVERYLGI